MKTGNFPKKGSNSLLERERELLKPGGLILFARAIITVSINWGYYLHQKLAKRCTCVFSIIPYNFRSCILLLNSTFYQKRNGTIKTLTSFTRITNLWQNGYLYQAWRVLQNTAYKKGHLIPHFLGNVYLKATFWSHLRWAT